jgi:hypothetical protein
MAPASGVGSTTEAWSTAPFDYSCSAKSWIVSHCATKFSASLERNWSNIETLAMTAQHGWPLF